MARRVLKSASIDDLLAEVNRRQKELPVLKKKRTQLLRELAKIDDKIAKLGGTTSVGGRRTGKRPSNKVSLTEAITSVLSKSKPKGVSEVVDAVKAAGYRSNSAQFKSIVSQTLSKTPEFKRASRGKYILA